MVQAAWAAITAKGAAFSGARMLSLYSDWNDMGRQMVRPRAGPEFFQRVGLNPGRVHIKLQGHAHRERVGALHHVIQAMDAFGSHVALRGNLGLCAVEVHPDQHSKLVCHEKFSALSWVPRRCGAPDNNRRNVIHATPPPVLDFCRGRDLGQPVQSGKNCLRQPALHKVHYRRLCAFRAYVHLCVVWLKLSHERDDCD